MSIANVFCQGPTGYMLTDSGYFSADGRLAELSCKVLELPRLAAAITVRGHVRARQHLGPAIKAAKLRDVYELLGMLPQMLYNAMDADGGFQSAETATIAASHLSVVYYCPRRARTAAVLIASDRTGLPAEYEPFTPLPVCEATAPGVDVGVALGRAVDVLDPSSFDPRRDGLAIMEAQRRSRWGFNGIEAGHHAAGAVNLTTITRRSVTTRPIHHWPDKVGERIAPQCTEG